VSGRAAELRPEPLRVPVTEVTVRHSLTGAPSRRREGLNPALIVVQRPVRIISDAPPAHGPAVVPAQVERDLSLEKSEERPTEPRDPSSDPLELDEEELDSEEDEQVVEVSVPPPAPPEALRASVPPASRTPSNEFEPLDLDEPVSDVQRDVGRVPSPPPPPLARGAVPESEAARSARVQDLRPTRPRPHAWWELFFDDDYLRTVRQPTPQQIARQCDFIVARLGLKPGATVLDVGCGLGLHVAELAARGYGSVGLDLSLAMLSRASEEAQGRGLRINFLHADMRELSFEGSFDAVTCLGTTLGYFDDETNRKVIEKLLKALKPGGALLLDVVNRDHVIRAQPNLVWFEGEGCVCMEESEFNYFTSRLQVKRTVILESGRQVEHEYALRLYSLHELGQLMNASGFRVTEVSGREALPGVFFGQESPNLMIVAVRRSANEQPANTNGAPETSG
jgi:SAM-dependent methyltransferase